MKQLLHILFAFSVAVASCQCVAAADHDMASLDMAEECHDTGSPAMEPVDCCDTSALASKTGFDKTGSMLATIDKPAFYMQLSAPEGVSAAIDYSRGPPPPTTPISRCDCLLA